MPAASRLPAFQFIMVEWWHVSTHLSHSHTFPRQTAMNIESYQIDNQWLLAGMSNKQDSHDDMLAYRKTLQHFTVKLCIPGQSPCIDTTPSDVEAWLVKYMLWHNPLPHTPHCERWIHSLTTWGMNRSLFCLRKEFNYHAISVLRNVNQYICFLKSVNSLRRSDAYMHL